MPFFHPNHTIMNNTNMDNIIDRDILQHDYILRIIDTMDYKDVERFVYDTIEQNLEMYTVDELIDEVTDNYPDLLGINEEDNISTPWWIHRSELTPLTNTHV